MLSVDFTPGQPDQALTTQWGAVPMYIEAHWNPRGEFWALTLQRVDTGETLIQGLPLAINRDNLAPYPFGVGILYAINTIGGDSPPTLANLGDTLLVYWVDPAELA